MKMKTLPPSEAAKRLLLFIVLVLLTGSLSAQVGINTDGSTPNSSAMLDIKSDTAGLLIPRMTATQRDAINSPAEGLMVFVTDDNTFYYYTGSVWTLISGDTGSWATAGQYLYPLDSNYNVGIGTSTPAGKFQVATRYYTGTYGADVCSGGTAAASESYTGHDAANAFDNTSSTYWSNNDNIPAWVQYDLGDGNEKRVSKYRLYFDATGGFDNSPNAWTFSGSNDGSAWTTFDTQTAQGWTATGWKEYIFTNTNHYRYYRLNITDNKNSGTSPGDNYVFVHEMELMEESLTNDATFTVIDNKVCIGTASPSQTLEVNGTFSYTDGNEGAGKIMISDASGTASWADGATVNAGGWTVNDNFIYNIGDSVGIGTATPGAALDVHGRIEQNGTGNSVFLGKQAGANDDLTTNRNCFVGYYTGRFNTSGSYNTAYGESALLYNKANSGSVAMGYHAMIYADNRTSGRTTYNTAVGYEALRGSTTLANNTGQYNTSMGFRSLWANKSGSYNTAIGVSALQSNTTGAYNTASGYTALLHSSTGSGNTADGNRALYNNTSGNNNTATGDSALYSNKANSGSVAFGKRAMLYADSRTSGRDTYNTAIGYEALMGSTTAANNTGQNNTSVGYQALMSNTTGGRNSASGYVALSSNTSGEYNTAFGYGTLYSNKANKGSVAIGYKAMENADNRTTGRTTYNTAIGYEALRGSTIAANNTGQNNTSIGSQALMSNTSGDYNSASGSSALNQNTSGDYNSAFGSSALIQNTTGDDNSAFGYAALYFNSTGNKNTAYGISALYNNRANSGSVAIGFHAMLRADNRTSGRDTYNTAVGYEALMGGSATLANNSGQYNTSMGYQSLLNNKGGDWNTGVGSKALVANTSGHGNSALGHYSLYSNTTGYDNVAIGSTSLAYCQTGYQNTAIGQNAFSTSSNYYNSTAIGYNAQIYASNHIQLGDDYVNWIGGHAPWTNTSDGRFKRNVEEGVPGLDFILKLRPVTYTWDLKALDRYIGVPDSISDKSATERAIQEQTLHTGFIAQEVEKAAKASGYDFDGVHHPANEHDPYSLAYGEFVVPLVKAVQEQQNMIIKQKSANEAQQQTIEKQQQTIRKLMQRLDRLEKMMETK